MIQDLDISLLVQRIKDEFSNELPGELGQFEMATAERRRSNRPNPQEKKPRIAAVLCHLYPKDGRIRVLLMKRKSYPGVHSDQISFPGGKVEETDTDLVDTAIRETEEEMGFRLPRDRVLGALSDLYIPPSNFLVYPFVGYSLQRLDIVPQDEEVDEVIEADLLPFIDGSIKSIQTIQTSYGAFKVPVYVYENYTIWGATVMMLSEMVPLIKKSLKD